MSRHNNFKVSYVHTQLESNIFQYGIKVCDSNLDYQINLDLIRVQHISLWYQSPNHQMSGLNILKSFGSILVSKIQRFNHHIYKSNIF